jgi:hypothetical protein
MNAKLFRNHSIVGYCEQNVESKPVKGVGVGGLSSTQLVVMPRT